MKLPPSNRRIFANSTPFKKGTAVISSKHSSTVNLYFFFFIINAIALEEMALPQKTTSGSWGFNSCHPMYHKISTTASTSYTLRCSSRSTHFEGGEPNAKEEISKDWTLSA